MEAAFDAAPGTGVPGSIVGFWPDHQLTGDASGLGRIWRNSEFAFNSLKRFGAATENVFAGYLRMSIKYLCDSSRRAMKFEYAPGGCRQRPAEVLAIQ